MGFGRPTFFYPMCVFFIIFTSSFYQKLKETRDGAWTENLPLELDE